MTLLLRPSPAQHADLQQFLSDLQNPASPLFHQWLTPEQYADRFGLSSKTCGGGRLVAIPWVQGQPGLSEPHVDRL